MSQPWQPQPNEGFGPPPPQQPQGGRGQVPPTVPQPQPGYGYPPPVPGAPPHQPYGAAQPPYGEPPKPPRPNKVWLALGLTVVATVVAAFLYAVLFHALYDAATYEVRQLSFHAPVAGVLIGLGPAFFARRNWGVYILAAVLSLAAVCFGELYGMAMILSEHFTLGGVPAHEIFLEGFEDLLELWRETAEPATYVSLLLAPVAAVSICLVVLKRERKREAGA
ncbi:hypothetical protein GCM10009716_31810 [Streptomyces sodiiphilus]|uniref:Uncharacterized protein n=1 Tax=Streptomyces sodiiphilus TaxID=226217 RepID=A0ABP5AVM3_9ACTN